MSNGQGCTCNAWAANECACGADWTPQEVYDLRAENNRLKAELKSIDDALDDPRANLTLTTAEIIWKIKAELAEAKKCKSNEDLQDVVSKALRNAWYLGQTYWQQVDSEYPSQWKKGDATQEKFNLLVEETRAAIDAAMKEEA